MAAVLGDYLDQAAHTPFAWDGHDCLRFPANWVRAATGYDPAAPWRGRYQTALGASRLLNRHGGLLPLVTRQMALFRPTTDPQTGDVGVVRVEGCEPGSQLVGAIRAGSARWVVLWAGGLWFGRPQTVAAWRVLEG